VPTFDGMMGSVPVVAASCPPAADPPGAVYAMRGFSF
jgi:hypothetical protein